MDRFDDTSLFGFHVLRLARDRYQFDRTLFAPSGKAAIEEILLLWISNSNPAFSPFLELFGDDTLEQETVYNRMINTLYRYFSGRTQEDTGQQKVIPTGENIIDFLLAPSRAAPHSLE